MIPQRGAGRIRSGAGRLFRRGVTTDAARTFTPFIDAKAASKLLGVPYTWLLAQARAGQIPHHRLGHYVRFNPDDVENWLKDTKIEPHAGYRGRLR